MSNFIPSVQLIDGYPRVTSLSVSEHFEKQHKDVLRAIDSVMSECPSEFNQRNFALVDFTDAKGESRPMYQLSRDGFTLVAMGFTGKKALAWKVRYIEAFNAMEHLLHNKQTSSPASPIPTSPSPLASQVNLYLKDNPPAPHIAEACQERLPFYASEGGVCIFLSSLHHWLSSRGEKLPPRHLAAKLRGHGCRPLRASVRLPKGETTRSVYLLPEKLEKQEKFDKLERLAELEKQVKLKQLEQKLAKLERLEALETQGQTALPRSFAAVPAATLADLRNDLIMIEAAIEGADMGEKELQEVVACKLLKLIDQLARMGDAV